MSDICLAYLSGNVIRFSMTFTNVDNTLTDPTTVTCEVGMTDDDITTLAVVRDGVGLYHADWDTTGVMAGTYYVEANGTGTVIAAAEVTVRIKSPHLTV